MYICNCGREFEKQRSLNSHARFCEKYVKKIKPASNYKISDGLYKCECDKIFNNSQSINAHFSHCLIHRKGIPENRSHVVEGRMCGWDKFSKKEIKEIHSKSNETLKQNFKSGKTIPSMLGKNHSIETKKIMSEKRSAYMEENPGLGIKWYTINGIKVQGEWERIFAEKLNDLKIKFSRKSLKYLKYRKYTPDFYLPDYDMYIEIKGWFRERDKYKMFKVLDEHKIDLRVVESLQTIKNFKLSDIELFETFNIKYKLEDIDFSKFNNQWD